MAQSMIERVARVITAHDGGKITGPSRHKASDEFGWGAGHNYRERYVEAHWREFVGHAISAIEVMRDAPIDVLTAFVDADISAEDARTRWNAALNEEEGRG